MRVEVLGHLLQLLVLRPDLLLVRPVLKLLRPRGVHFGILLEQLVGVARGRPPGVLGRHHLAFGDLGHGVHLLEARVAVPGHAHLPVAAVELVEVDEVGEGARARVLDLGLVHLGRIPGVFVDRLGAAVSGRELCGEVVQVAVQRSRRRETSAGDSLTEKGGGGEGGGAADDEGGNREFRHRD